MSDEPVSLPEVPDSSPATNGPAPSEAAPGWYLDGTDPRKRYWDGKAWTDRYEEPKVRRKISLRTFVWVSAGALVLGIIMGSASAISGYSTQLAALKGKVSALQTTNSELKGSNDSLQLKNDTMQTAAADVVKQKAALDAQQATLDAAAAKVKADTIPGNGTYLVGTDIQAGTYRSTGNSGCYWSRLSGLSGGLGDIIANANVDGQAVVTIAASDKAFETARCSDWQKVG